MNIFSPFSGSPKISLLKLITLETSENTKDLPELERCSHHHVFVIDDLQRGRKNHSVLNPKLPEGSDQEKSELVATGFTEAQFHCWKRVPDPPQPKLPEPEKGDDYIGQLEEIKIGERSVGHAYNIPRTRRNHFGVRDEAAFTVSESIIVPLPKQDQRDTTEWTDNNRLANRFEHWAKIKGELWKVSPERILELDEHMYNNVLFKRRRVIVEIPLKCVNGDGSITRIVTEQEAYMYIGIEEKWEPHIDGGYLFQPMKIYNNSSLSRKYYCYTKLEDEDQ